MEQKVWKAGIEFEKLLEKKSERESLYLYYYDDLDGDGKPEFAVNQGGLYMQESCYFKKIVGAGQVWYHDGLHANVIRDRLINISQGNEEEWIINLEEGIDERYPYYMVGIGEDEQVDVGKDNWDEITAPFFEMVEKHGLKEKTLEEVLGRCCNENKDFLQG